jgi:hypothetical protein
LTRRGGVAIVRRSQEACHLQTETPSAVIASNAKQSRLRDCGAGLVWIASLSLAMTAHRIRLQRIML